ncbi:MAG: CPBP family intramembrane metalloprotease [Anaerolineae bacterium]|nr:CPBP family intramembrane metalloprotease [Anaerolineae bacterium]
MKLSTLFRDVRAVSWPVIVLLVVASVVMAVIVNQVFFYYGTFSPIYAATSGLINATLCASVVVMLVLLGGVMLLVGRLRPRDVGLRLSHVPAAGVFTLLVWLILQLVEVIAGLVSGSGIALHPRWDSGALPVIGSLIGQVFGNALEEEIRYRGFLLPQLYLKLNAAALRKRPLVRVTLAVLAMALVFMLLHIPNRIAMQMGFADLPQLFVQGVGFALIYLRTGNLLLAVGIHAIGNAPTMLVAETLGYELPFVLLELAIIVCWPWLARGYARLFGRVPTPEPG